MRLVRLLQFVSELRTMVGSCMFWFRRVAIEHAASHYAWGSQVMSIVGSMKSLVWTILLMLIIKYIIGVPWPHCVTG